MHQSRLFVFIFPTFTLICSRNRPHFFIYFHLPPTVSDSEAGFPKNLINTDAVLANVFFLSRRFVMREKPSLFCSNHSRSEHSCDTRTLQQKNSPATAQPSDQQPGPKRLVSLCEFFLEDPEGCLAWGHAVAIFSTLRRQHELEWICG